MARTLLTGMMTALAIASAVPSLAMAEEIESPSPLKEGTAPASEDAKRLFATTESDAVISLPTVLIALGAVAGIGTVGMLVWKRHTEAPYDDTSSSSTDVTMTEDDVSEELKYWHQYGADDNG